MTQGYRRLNNSWGHSVSRRPSPLCSSAPTPPHGSGFSDSVIQDVIHSHLVLPNRITIPLVGDVELAKLRFPMPKVTGFHCPVLILLQSLFHTLTSQ